MRIGIYIAVLAVIASSCAHDISTRRVYVGEVTSVQPAEGEHFSPTKGPVPMTFITVHIGEDSQASDARRLRIALTEIYSAAVYGSVGDKVSFRYFARLPFSGQLSFSDIDEYRITKKRG